MPCAAVSGTVAAVLGHDAAADDASETAVAVGKILLAAGGALLCGAAVAPPMPASAVAWWEHGAAGWPLNALAPEGLLPVLQLLQLAAVWMVESMKTFQALPMCSLKHAPPHYVGCWQDVVLLAVVCHGFHVD